MFVCVCGVEAIVMTATARPNTAEKMYAVS
jgi:hypothetical protein